MLMKFQNDLWKKIVYGKPLSNLDKTVKSTLNVCKC